MKNVRGKIIAVGLMMVSFLFLVCTDAVFAKNESKKPIKIGIPSAWDFAGGQGVKKGSEMAIRDINKAGGILGRKVEGIYYDNKANADETKKAVERLLYRDNVDVIIGFWRSDVAIAGQPLVMEANKILVLAAPAAPVLTFERIGKNYEVYKNTFTIQPNTNYLFEAFEFGIAEGIDQGLDKIAVMVEKTAWADPLFDDIMQKFKDNIVYSTRISPTIQDFQIEFSKAKAAGAKNLFMVLTGSSGTAAVKQWYDMQLPMIYTSYNVDAQAVDFWKNTEGKAEGVVTSLVGGTVGFPMTEKSRPWYEDYIKTYGEKPAAYSSGYAYDAIMVWEQAVKIAGTTETNAVRNALESKDFNYLGVCGTIVGFDEVHNPIGLEWGKGGPWGFVSVQWQNGEQKLLFPKNIKTAKPSTMVVPDRVKKIMQK